MGSPDVMTPVFDGGASGPPERWEPDERFDPPPVTDDGGMGAPYEHPTDDAPYGRNPKTGKPYTMSAEKRAEMGARLAAGRRAASQNGRAPRKRSGGGSGKATPARAPRAPQGPDYRMAVAGLLQLPAMGLGILGRFNVAFALDSAALAVHTPQVADAVHHLALDDPRIAAVLDRVMQVGPYGALVASVSPLILQILCNHGWLKPNESMGTMTPEQLLEAIDPHGPDEP